MKLCIFSDEISFRLSHLNFFSFEVTEDETVPVKSKNSHRNKTLCTPNYFFNYSFLFLQFNWQFKNVVCAKG